MSECLGRKSRPGKKSSNRMRARLRLKVLASFVSKPNLENKTILVDDDDDDDDWHWQNKRGARNSASLRSFAFDSWPVVGANCQTWALASQPASCHRCVSRQTGSSANWFVRENSFSLENNSIAFAKKKKCTLQAIMMSCFFVPSPFNLLSIH